MNKSKTLSSEEIQVLEQEAMEACELIEKTYKWFGVNQERVEVFRNENGFEELSYSGVWFCHYPDHHYSVNCKPEYVFRFFRDEYLISNGYADEYENGKLTDEGSRARVASYFRRFIQLTRERYESIQK